LWVETRSALRNWSDASHRRRALPLPINVIGNGTMAQRAAWHGTVDRFENRHQRLLSDMAKRNNHNTNEEK